ncbi:uncharacterized protein CLUP02_17341 [Colletotrichum lupini]|uniref:Uncharacterized protein n=1 Tax=Colletotrichum lupini TaxID=145971 RepID=A0A9Q8WAP1_9PEZI|nr:uncharacterized protein CLUP02_17341 [Colletotrichum lupini]UQC75832.1 hypothetical protein CLUP02_17341 [Colletotrichum lupini]
MRILSVRSIASPSAPTAERDSRRRPTITQLPWAQQRLRPTSLVKASPTLTMHMDGGLSSERHLSSSLHTQYTPANPEQSWDEIVGLAQQTAGTLHFCGIAAYSLYQWVCLVKARIPIVSEARRPGISLPPNLADTQETDLDCVVGRIVKWKPNSRLSPENANIDDGALMSVDHVLPLSAITAGRPRWDGLWWLLVGTVSSQVDGQGNESLAIRTRYSYSTKLASSSPGTHGGREGKVVWRKRRLTVPVLCRAVLYVPYKVYHSRCWQANSSDGVEVRTMCKMGRPRPLPALVNIEYLLFGWLLLQRSKSLFKVLPSALLSTLALFVLCRGLLLLRGRARWIIGQISVMRRYGQFCAVQPLQTLAGGGHWARPGGAPPSQIPSPGFSRWTVTQWALSLGHWQLAKTGQVRGHWWATANAGYSLPGLTFPRRVPFRGLAQTCTNACTHRPSSCPTSTNTPESELRTTNGADPSSPSNSLHKHGSVGLADEMDNVSWKNPNPDEMIIGGNLHLQHPLVEIPRQPPPCNAPTLAAHVFDAFDLSPWPGLPPATCSQESIMLYKVALTRVTTRVASNTPVRMAPFDNLDHYHRTESKLDSLIALDVSSESNANDTTAIPHAFKFQQAAVVGPTPAYSRYHSPTGLPLERPDLVPFPSAPSLLDFHLPHAIVWMAENTRPMGADAGVVSLSRMSHEIWSSSETTMHNDPGSGKINTINTESRFHGTRAQLRRAGGNLLTGCYCLSTGKPAAVNISATRQVGLVSADQPVTQSFDQNALGGHASPANGLALSD